jgi:nucleotide-binding universal stress UspA family protein
MQFADILLHIQGYPDETNMEDVDNAVRLAARLRATMTALAMTVRIPMQPNWLADQIVGLTDIARDAERRCAASCEERIEHFRVQARQYEVAAETRTVIEDLYLQAVRLSQEARAYDFCIHVPPARGLDKVLVETLIFRSGRPVLVLPAGSPTAFDRVAVAWDGGSAAARALNDALPMLRAAKTVQLVLAEGDKPDREETLGQAIRHLERHGVKATSRVLAPEGRPATLVLQHYLDSEAPDLLVMGAYGHSRFREMVLGGVTDHMLSDPRTPVWFSH